jgi:hypothetical protein
MAMARGFYPGSRPGECTNGTAATFEQARLVFERAWAVFLARRTEADFKRGASIRLALPRNIDASIAVNGCGRIGRIKINLQEYLLVQTACESEAQPPEAFECGGCG